jgi:anti-anti-sigma factor
MRDTDTPLDVRTDADGSLVVRPRGAMDDGSAVHLRQVLIHAVRKVRPPRLILDLSDVTAIDPINLGTVVALCDLADDHRVTVRIANASTGVADRLQMAGVPPRCLRAHATDGLAIV